MHGEKAGGDDVQEEVEEDVGNSKFTTQTKFNHGSIHVTYATVLTPLARGNPTGFVLNLTDCKGGPGRWPHISRQPRLVSL